MKTPVKRSKPTAAKPRTRLLTRLSERLNTVKEIKRIGRPSKLTSEVMERFLQAICLGASYETAANFAGIGASTVRRWLKDGRDKLDSEFEDFQALTELAGADGEVAMVTAISATKADGAKWILSKRYPERFGDKSLLLAAIRREVESLLDMAAAVLEPSQYEKLEAALAAKYEESEQ